MAEVRREAHFYQAWINNAGRLHQFPVCVGGRDSVLKTKGGGLIADYFPVKEGNLGAIIDTRRQMKTFEKSVALYEQLVAAQQTGVKIKSTGVFYNPESSCVSLLNPDLRADIL